METDTNNGKDNNQGDGGDGNMPITGILVSPQEHEDLLAGTSGHLQSLSGKPENVVANQSKESTFAL